MVGFWKLGAMAWCLTVLSWLLVPVITVLVNKLFAYLCVDLDQKLKELKVCSIPTLKEMLMAVQKQRIEGAAINKISEYDLRILDELAKDIRSALYDADDILDLLEYYQIQKKLVGDRSTWQQHLLEAIGRCIASWKGQFRRSPAFEAVRLPCAQGLDHLDQQLLPLWRRVTPCGTPEDEEQQASPDLEAHRLLPHGPEATLNSVLQRLYSCFLVISNCCGSILSWLQDVIEILCRYRDRSYEVVGIKHNKKDGIGLDSFHLMIHGKSLREIIEHIDSIITLSKKSPLLNGQRSRGEHSINDTDKESSSCSNHYVQDRDFESRRKQKEIADMHRNITQQVFGREKDRKDVCKLLREGRNSHYSVICIHGIAGSGKTTLARYVCDYEKESADKHFDPIMFIQVSKTFRLHDIIIDMLMEIAGQDGQSSGKNLKSLETQCEELTEKMESRSLNSLCAKLKEKLNGKRFLLALDDMWVFDENQKERDILLDVFTTGDGGSRILVTSQIEDAAAALGPDHVTFKIRDLEQHECLSLFMNYALQGTVDNGGKLQRIGSKIVGKLHRSPLAAVTVAKRLRGKGIDTWETTGNLDVLNETMGALWWSYEQLCPEIRRCFEYCSTFPKGYIMGQDRWVHLWIAQGFVNTNNETEEPEDVGKHYFDELLTFSFFSATPKGFTIHDLLHELVERVTGSDFFRIGVNGFDSQHGTSPEVRHLFIETYDRWKMPTKQILELENLRTLIIKEKYRLDEYTAFDDVEPQDLIEEKLIDGIFKQMRKLRVLIINIKHRQDLVFSIPDSIVQMKHLRLFHFHWNVKLYRTEQVRRQVLPKRNLILPGTFSQLYRLQDFVSVGGAEVSWPEDWPDNLIQLRRLTTYQGFPNIGRLTSLKWIMDFIVKKEKGYELKQLKHLNKLRGCLQIRGLENVRSKDEALEGNLAGKTHLEILLLEFYGSNPDVEDVLEGLLPPKDLKELVVQNYSGSWCPSWMCENPDAPKNMDRLFLYRCSRVVQIPEGSEFFAGLRWLTISMCSWDALPDHMERLTSLEKLEIRDCNEIELLPTALPRSLEKISIIGEKSRLWKSFQDLMHINWKMIEHISCKEFDPPHHKIRSTIL